MDNKTSLEILTQVGKEIKINGEVLKIEAFKLVALPKVSTALQNILADVLSLFEPDNGIQFEQGKAIVISEKGWMLISGAITRNIDSIVEILSAYTRKPKEWFLDEETGIDVEETIVLIFAIVEKHYDFFTGRLAPILTGIKQKKN